MTIEHNVRNDSLIFRSASTGTIQLEDNKYSHISTLSSGATTGTKSEYTWKIKGNQLIQTGTITRTDGKKSVLDEVVFKRVGGSGANSQNPIVGTWNQLSSEGTWFDGTKYSQTNPEMRRFDIITPTHWMRIAHRGNKFESAGFGLCTIQNDKLQLSVTVASYPISYNIIYESTYRVEGNKLYTHGMATNAKGKKMTWSDVFEKVGGN